MRLKSTPWQTKKGWPIYYNLQARFKINLWVMFPTLAYRGMPDLFLLFSHARKSNYFILSLFQQKIKTECGSSFFFEIRKQPLYHFFFDVFFSQTVE